MSTVFSQKRWEFTKRAHLAAQRQFYPLMFPYGVEFLDTTKTVQDLNYAIDCQLSVQVRGLRGPILYFVQERFRTPSHERFGDITITEWNLNTNEPSELHKLGAQLFVYGFYDEVRDHIRLAIAVDVPLLQQALVEDRLQYKRQRRGDQSFLAFDFCEVEALGAVLFRHDDRNQLKAM